MCTVDYCLKNLSIAMKLSWTCIYMCFIFLNSLEYNIDAVNDPMTIVTPICDHHIRNNLIVYAVCLFVCCVQETAGEGSSALQARWDRLWTWHYARAR